jgi:hypothetical protein
MVGICGMAIQFQRQAELLVYYRATGYFVIAGDTKQKRSSLIDEGGTPANFISSYNPSAVQVVISTCSISPSGLLP